MHLCHLYLYAMLYLASVASGMGKRIQDSVPSETSSVVPIEPSESTWDLSWNRMVRVDYTL